MRIALLEAAQRDARALSQEQRAALFDVLLALPTVVGEPHRHAGTGLRKLHSSGIWEARVGLGLRLVFTLKDDTATLLRIGTHDEVRRYLRTL